MNAAIALMDACRNHFVQGWREGRFTVSSGVLLLDNPPSCTFVEVRGSHDDGIWEAASTGVGLALTYEGEPMQDGVFNGKVTFLKPKRAFMSLASEIGTYVEKHPASPYTSESFGPSSYTIASGTNGAPVGWIQVFKDRMVPWRRMFNDLEG